jgi:hypothetical protein
MANDDTRGQYAPFKAPSATDLQRLEWTVEPRTLEFAPPPASTSDYQIGPKGAVTLIVTLGVIVGIGVIGTMRGVRWM